MDQRFTINTKKEGKITLGFLAPADCYETVSKMMAGAFESARNHHVNMIRFSSLIQFWDEERFDFELNILSELIEQHNLDGLLFLGWMFSSSEKTLQQLLNRFRSIPLFSIGKQFDNIPHISLIGGVYVKEMLHHLIDFHGYKRILFIPPSFNDDRKDAYIELMKEQGLYDPRYILDNETLNQYTFDKRMRHAVKIIRDKLNFEIDAIMAMIPSDAKYIISELEAIGIRVPEDMAVVTYDYNNEVKYSIPTLTTIYYPWLELGYQGCDKMIQLLRTGSIPLSNAVSSRIIVRESCGCLPQGNPSPDFKTIVQAPLSLSDISLDVQENLLRKAKQNSNYEVFDVPLLFGAFLDSYREKNNSFFMKQLNQLLTLSMKNGTFSGEHFEKDLKFFFDLLLPYIINNGQLPLWLYELLSKSQALLKDKQLLQQGLEDVKIKLLGEDMINISQNMISSNSVNKLLDEDIVEKFIHIFNIPSCFIFMFTKNEDRYKNCQLIFEYRDIHFSRPNTIIENPAAYLLDAFGGNWMHTIIQNLCIGLDIYGFIVFEPGPMIGQVYHTLTTELTTALKSIYSNRELHQKNTELNHMLEMLKKTQAHLVQSEKMVSLGRLVAGVAHEINTPIGVSLTAISFQTEKTKDIKNMIQNNKISKQVLEDYLDTMDKASSMSVKNLMKASELITSFKRVAIDQSSEEKRAFKFKEYVETILLSLSSEIGATKHHIEISCSKDLMITSYPGAISQIITYFIMNSMIHAFNEGDCGTIIIHVEKIDRQVILRYSDNGKGILEQDLHKIFDPFFTTNRASGGKGLGLHIVYNIVTQLLKGEIRCESRPQEGTIFILEFLEEDLSTVCFKTTV